MKGLNNRLKAKAKPSSSVIGVNGIKKAGVAGDALDGEVRLEPKPGGPGGAVPKASKDRVPGGVRVTWTVKRVWKTLTSAL